MSIQQFLELNIGQQKVILGYKTKWCHINEDHERHNCWFAHPGYDEFRRDLINLQENRYNYEPELCKSLDCEDKKTCTNCHNRYELLFHPVNYKRKICDQAGNCKKDKDLCPYIHIIEDSPSSHQTSISQEQQQIYKINQNSQKQVNQQSRLSQPPPGHLPIPQSHKVYEQPILISPNNQQYFLEENKNSQQLQNIPIVGFQNQYQSYTNQMSHQQQQVSFTEQNQLANQQQTYYQHIQQQKIHYNQHPVQSPNQIVYPNVPSQSSIIQFQKQKNIENLESQQNQNNKPSYSTFSLETFKTEKCEISQKHNLKRCLYYHNENDKRRNPIIYDYCFDLCPNSPNGGEDCEKGDQCDFSHNKVEQLYHADRYKSKFCNFYPNRIYECPYEDYCSFAHMEHEISIELIDKYRKDDDFYMYKYKTVWCPNTYNHDRGSCVYAHNVQDFRRNPTNLLNIECEYWTKSDNVTQYSQGGCRDNLSCIKCHGWKEFEYHPLNYKTKFCTNKLSCKKADCAYIHQNAQDKNRPLANKGMPINVFGQNMQPIFHQNQLNFSQTKNPHSYSHFQSPVIPIRSDINLSSYEGIQDFQNYIINEDNKLNNHFYKSQNQENPPRSFNSTTRDHSRDSKKSDSTRKSSFFSKKKLAMKIDSESYNPNEEILSNDQNYNDKNTQENKQTRKYVSAPQTPNLPKESTFDEKEIEENRKKEKSLTSDSIDPNQIKMKKNSFADFDEKDFEFEQINKLITNSFNLEDDFIQDSKSKSQFLKNNKMFKGLEDKDFEFFNQINENKDDDNTSFNHQIFQNYQNFYQ